MARSTSRRSAGSPSTAWSPLATAGPEIAAATDLPAQTGDLVIALAGYDNVDQRDHSGFSHPPAGWIALGLNDDAANNVPSELCYRTAPADGAQAVTWTWTDPSVNVTAAVIAALR
jgi:hypothetical protein